MLPRTCDSVWYAGLVSFGICVCIIKGPVPLLHASVPCILMGSMWNWNLLNVFLVWMCKVCKAGIPAILWTGPLLDPNSFSMWAALGAGFRLDFYLNWIWVSLLYMGPSWTLVPMYTGCIRFSLALYLSLAMNFFFFFLNDVLAVKFRLTFFLW